ncbi:MAG: peptide deformylase [Desulfuromonas sp.]|nr:MAG: peptide deformylase [Desulfuromonas sp.]
MAVLEILHYPDERLSRKCEPVPEITPELIKLADDMVETMYDAPGVGLAAPQVGVLQRLVVIDCAPSDEAADLITAFNPEIVERDGECFEEEGCLSVPGYAAKVHRAARVKVRYQDRDGAMVEREADGLLAVAFQHEIDHLDGILYVDRLSSLKRGMFRKKYQKMLAQSEPS